MDENRSHTFPLVEDSPVAATAELRDSLSRVEHYQPLYGISGIADPLRSCRDRAVAIEAALKEMKHQWVNHRWMKLPMRLIDFGSSQGYFPFFFADRGAVATGLDLNPRNTIVALAVQRLNGLSATFGTAALNLDTVGAIKPGEYDVALMLSILHHVTHERGVDYVRKLLLEMMSRVPMLILELAHRHEEVPYPWRASQPEDPLSILSACGDVQIKLLGQFPTHLSKSMRPMYLVMR